MIPKIIHQIWIGPNPIPDNCKQFSENLQEINNDFEYKLWTNDNMPELPEKCKIQFDRYQKMALKSDVLRYFLLETYGGIYVDMDFECFKNFSELTNTDIFVAFPNSTGHWITNCIFGCCKNHPLLKNIIDNMKNEPYHGPIFLSNEIKKSLGLALGDGSSRNEFKAAMENIGIKYYDPVYFFSRTENPTRFAYHHALRSWIEPKSLTNT
jgi:hypothetical protein